MELAKYIDHTLLNPGAVSGDIEQLCQEAVEHGFYSVVVHPSWVSFAVDRLKGSDVKVCSVVGFPSGCHLTETKVQEAASLAELGVDELDMVMNIGWAKEGMWDKVEEDIWQVVEACKGKWLKVILETGLLTDEEIVRASKVSEEAGAHFVKTSTGFNCEGATVEVVRLMREAVSDKVEVKASGGIRYKETALQMIEAGATRIGASSSVSIVE